MKAKKKSAGPRRSVLIMAVSAEEKGLLGSKYYTENPVYPLEKTIANLNIDMIGRVDKLHENGDYVYLIGSDRLSIELHNISEEVNRKNFNLELDYTFNEKDDPNRYYYRSDHYNFAKNNIPVIFYFNGVHEDYHKPTDTMEKIVDVHYPKIKSKLVSESLKVFYELRDVPGIKKKPSTSELLDWLKLLMNEDIKPEMLREKNANNLIPPLHGALLKNEQDVHLFERLAFLARRENG